MAEVVYYQQGNILISNARAVFGATTYPVANITSVGLGTLLPNFVFGCAPMVLSVPGLWFSLIGQDLRIIGVVWAVVFIGLGVLYFGLNIGKYFVRIASAGGEQRAFVSRDKAEVEKIVVALNEAIIKRG